MNYKLKYKIRALILLVVFSLNTIAGFACSVGIDLGYNHHHHDHHDNVSGRGQEATEHQQQSKEGKELNGIKEDCCTSDVVEFTLLDKLLATNIIHQLQAPVSIIKFLAVYPIVIIKDAVKPVNSNFQFVRRSCFLNDTDPQLAIRRFQI